VTFNALTTIDTATNLVEIIRVDNKTCRHVTDKLRQYWLSRYPHPQRIVHDGRGEFVGHKFKEFCRTFGDIGDPQSTAKTCSQIQFVNECIRQLKRAQSFTI
jgi:hypothetical protein